MKKLFCILAVAALAGACEQKTEVTTPASQTPDTNTEAHVEKRKKMRVDTSNAVPAPTGEALPQTKEEIEKNEAARKAQAEANPEPERNDTSTVTISTPSP